MLKPRKKSFFERLTGAINTNGYDDMEVSYDAETETKNIKVTSTDDDKREIAFAEEEEVGQLTVDVYQTPSEIVIKTMVAGVKPDTLDIQIARDMVTIKGTRQNSNEVREEDYFHRELYWGSFSRTILLPAEVEVEEAEATEEHGLLILKLPKIDKDKKTKLKVRSNSR
jgi:HSP20 family protein